LVPSQWLRIVEDGEDVGHIHIRQAQAEMLGHPGIRIEIAQRLVTDTGILDTVSELFASTSGTTELWSIRSARRDKDELESELPDREQVRSVEAWVNTGVRSRQELTVSREGPNELDRDQWRQLPEAYLSQVDLHLLPALLPRDREVTMAFYTYYPKTSQLGLRRIRVEPIDDGGYRVIQRPAPDQGEQVSRYDAEGRLVQRHMADGRVILPSSEDRVRRIWADR
ncbi:MAG: hypothetical protein ACODAQ_06970, partial [Phycisphaeraceae bacterium]